VAVQGVYVVDSFDSSGWLPPGLNSGARSGEGSQGALLALGVERYELRRQHHDGLLAVGYA